MNEEDIQEALKIFPIWDASVWEPLQEKNYEEAERKLELIFENIDLDDWPVVYWQGIFSGIPSVLGDISELEWKNMVRPIIVKSLIMAASGKGLSVTIQNLEQPEQMEFIGLFIKNIPGAINEEKREWLKEKRPSIYMFAMSVPGQELGINPIRYSDNLSMVTLIKKFNVLPKKLRDSLFSYRNAEIIFRAGRNNHLSDEKISLLSRIAGRVLMGFVHMEDFQKEIELGLSIDTRIASVLTKEMEDKIFYSVSSDISDVYEPFNLSSEKNKDSNESAEIPISEFSSDAEETIPVMSSESPFILHEEKSPASEEKKSSFRGFSMPFGFFKSKNQPAPVGKSTKVEIETSNDSPKNEKRTVNYSELRTSLSPFDTEQGFINPVKNEPISAPIVPIPEIKPVPAAPEIPPLPEEKRNEIFGTIKKSQPKTEGNIIDLKN